MKLSEKIQLLRKKSGYSQEELASICNVSRQSISKWEADIALPETEKLIILSDTFKVTIDVLLKDELAINDIQQVSCCGANAVQKKKAALFEGVVIKESIEDETILDYMQVHKIELWNTGGRPKYWTVIFFTSKEPRFPEMVSKALISSERGNVNWFVDFKEGNIKYIVFRNKILTYQIGNADEKEKVCAECRRLGIPNEQMHWQE